VRGRELLVLRHAKSAWDTDAETDFERPLAKRGRRDCPRIGAFIAGNDLVPDLVVSSPAERARETARRVLEAAGGDPETVVFDEEFYGGGTEEIRRALADVPGTFRRVMVVGHNPGFESFAQWLSGAPLPAPEEVKTFPTGALARFRMPEDWTTISAGSGELVQLVRPRELPER
jgi:phosphohistidine phosphatase